MVVTRKRPDKVPLVLDTDKMKTLRLKLGLSMDDAAKKAGFSSRQRWYEIESGQNINVKIDTLNSIAKALGVAGKDLLK